MLYRAQSLRHLPYNAGTFTNPYLKRIRQPRDLSTFIHKTAGDWFEMTFGLNYRAKSLFCTSSVEVARGYLTSTSALIAVTPVGDYSICYSKKCKDLFGHFQFRQLAGMINQQQIYHDLELLDYVVFRNSELDNAVAIENEIMIYAERFAYQKIA